MALLDSMLNIFTKQPKDPDAPKPAPGSRSEREAKIKDKAGMVINVFAMLLAVNTYIGGTLSSTVMNNTIKANDLYNFYQAKSIKQSVAELGADLATVRNDKEAASKYLEKAARYESDPATGEGKKELLAKAKKLEDERDMAKKRSPWISYASTAFQLSIVLLSASILAVNMMMFWASFGVAGVGLLLMSQGIWMWF
jgi:Domain of unknown function (DUF4337)